MPKSVATEEEKISQQFTCRDSQGPPTDFKGVDIHHHGLTITASQTEYLSHLHIPDAPTKSTKEEDNRTLTESETSTLRSIAGKMAWVATCTSPLYAFHASVALQRHTEEPGTPLSVLISTHAALRQAKENQHAKLNYIPLDSPTTHIRIYADAAFQNLRTKHSQIGFIVYLADKDDNVNIAHWHSSRAPRQPHSTDQAELMALDIALRSTENMANIINTFYGRTIPVVLFIDCDTLWTNFMKETVPTIAEIGYRWRDSLRLSPPLGCTRHV